MDTINESQKLEKIQHYFNLAKEASIPKDVYLQVTKKCNLRCNMCDIWKNEEKNPPLQTIMDIIHAVRDKAAKWVTLWGGEPYIHPDIIEIMKEVKKCGMKLQLITNGTLITGDKLQATHDYADNVVFSIDSPYEEVHDKIRGKKGAFEATVKNLKALVALKKKSGKGPGIELDTTVLAANIDHLEKMIPFSQQIGLDMLVDYDPAQLHGTGNASDKSIIKIPQEIIRQKIGELIQLAKNGAHITSPAKLALIQKYLLGEPINGSCYSIFKDLLLSPQGDAYFCWGSDKIVGNILDPDFEKKWAHSISANCEAITGDTERCKGCGFSHVRWPDPGYSEIIEGINKIRKEFYKMLI